jgi:hypothetical protein
VKAFAEERARAATGSRIAFSDGMEGFHEN